MKKITVIGAGNVGATAVQRMAELEMGDLVMLDIVEGIPQGKALDLMQSAPLMEYDSHIRGTNDYNDITGSDVVVITAGVPRKPGMDRKDLLKINSNIIKDVCTNITEYAPDAVVIVVTNPLDPMTYLASRVLDMPDNRVFGMGGMLDSTRFATFVAMELGCSVKDISAMVIGSHDNLMLPLPQYTTVSGIPITELMDEDTIQELVDRTINGGAEIVKYFKNGSAFYAPAASITHMVESVIRDSKRIMPATAYLKGEYGYDGVYAGVPAKIGREGVEDIIDLKLSDKQKELLTKSVVNIQSSIELLELE
ncbi:malate dehydrogenase, NAD-dependent [Methanosalsum zhilinae DSM 4017]|uniref:Malate dehydrogenase n=1 Tax=Methanosalsum zhilinae (strain DSM 4017 / NBRC 107636 / OCM 62 / WeN5) TaxID=679901 RepID=F7XQC3_METZD|nr:malate dehydrogenase [Methanosalsum zhilinae]AEH61587.1 malate dehydrogenase, NAD-dependent [Methanosalsum zhilinae DSM 4017]